MSDEVLLLNAIGISKSFGGLQALSDVSVSMRRDELLGMIGPNGSGKSTFVNAVTGAIRFDVGEVLLDGIKLTGKSQADIAKAGIARTFQAVRVFDALSVRRNVMAGVLGHATISTAEANDRIEGALKRVGLEVKLSRLAGSLSLYDRRRLELATRLISRPKLIMLDEPMGGLNPDEIRAMMSLIESLRSEAGIFIIEHTMKAITQLADRVVVLDNGRKLIDDAPQVVLHDRAVIEIYLGLSDDDDA
jgi:ABC-type branched-subunit amino acid transport system ATPase component